MRTYTTQRVNPAPPILDGRLDDGAWSRVDWEGEFTQFEPYNGQAPSEAAAFKILFDDRNIYIGLRAFDSRPDLIDRRLSRRDQVGGDILAVQIDSYFDHRTAFTFMVNAAGVKMDGVFTNDGENEDWAPDPIWLVKTHIDDEGWTAEMRIPLSQLRFGRKDHHVWGLQVGRLLFRKEELSLWQPLAKDAPGWVHHFGELHGIDGIEQVRRFEILPYSVGKSEWYEKDADDPFLTGRSSALTLGLDAKIGVTSDLTMDLTINPDFGQVEADPSEVNLTAYETFFEEKRPFFIEGKHILSFPIMMGDGDMANDNLFYSRRIGRAPHHDPDLEDDEYADIPQNTSILGAVKLTGKTRGGLSVGVLDAVTSREEAEVDLPGSRRSLTVEPTTNYFLGRVQKDLNGGATTLGGMVTHTHRKLQDDHLDDLNRNALTGGLDFMHQWKDRTYYLIFRSVFSHIQGSEEAMLEAQTSSLRYYQRPDAKHVSLDSTRTSLSGYGGSLFFGKGGNGHWNFTMGGTWRSPGLELNDVGYQREADFIIQFVNVNYRIWEPFSIFRELNANVNQYSVWNCARERAITGGNINFNLGFKNYWGFNAGVERNSEVLSVSSLRGGPGILLPANWRTWFFFHTDGKKMFQLDLNGRVRKQSDGFSRSLQFGTDLTWRPSHAFSFSAGPFYQNNRENLQYVDTVDFGEEERYVFGRMHQETFGLVLRINYCITPDLTIEFYGQPFVSAGAYSRYKLIMDSRAERYEDRFHTFAESEISYDAEDEQYTVDEDRDGNGDYVFDLPDFNFRQFRSNLVVRWEYMPGSTLFFVWSQERTGDEAVGDFRLRNDMDTLFNVHPHNVFLIKINKWFSI